MTDEEARTLIIVREKGAISNAEYRTIHAVDTLTASSHLRRLRDLGLLEQKGRGNTTFYVPTIRLLTPGITAESSLPDGLTPQIDLSLGKELTEKLLKIGQRSSPDSIKQIIKELCASRPFKPSEIALLLKRNARHLRNAYLTPMVEAGDVELMFPENPAHPQQAYRTKKS